MMSHSGFSGIDSGVLPYRDLPFLDPIICFPAQKNILAIGIVDDVRSIRGIDLTDRVPGV